MFFHKQHHFKPRWLVLFVMAGLLLIWWTNRGKALNPVTLPARPATQPTTRPAPWLLSVTPTPRQWNQKGLFEVFSIAEQIAPMVCLPDPVDWWSANGQPATKSKPYRDHLWQRVLIDQHKLDVFIQMDPYPNRRGPISNLPKQVRSPSFSDPVLRKAFIADAQQRAQLYRPKYLCLAMEINAYYEQHPEDFEHFVTLFSEARTAVKKIDPEIVVLVSFQYEQLLGIFGGQTGLPRHEPHWKLLDLFGPDLDAVGISSYPLKSLDPPRFPSGDALPKDYYARIAEHTNKPIVFAELGWATDPSYGGSPQDQAVFIERLPALLEGLDVRLINYNFLFDAKGFGKVFESMGLIDEKGNTKPAMKVWLGL